jgi:segregation and condensation protein A
MNYQVAGFQSNDYRVSTEVYEGPLDLLLELIQKAELDITKLALAQVTDQYLVYMHELTNLEASQVSGFLVIAAKLLQIKSEALLPRPVERDLGEEDPAELLAQQLLTYRRYKLAAEWLAQQDLAHRHTYLHISTPPKMEGKFTLTDLSLDDLVNSARMVFNSEREVPLLSEVVALPRINIREKIQDLLLILNKNSQTTFDALLAQNHSRFEVVVTFLAVLELVKRKVIQAQQAELFAEIEIQLIAEWIPNGDLDLEFDE